MAPLIYTGEPPPPLGPTSNNRDVPPKKSLGHEENSSKTSHVKPGNGMGPRVRQIRPLTVDEALQYSPFSSIIPLNPSTSPICVQPTFFEADRLDILPIPTADIHSSQSIFPTQSEKRMSRQQLDLLDRTLQQGRGQSELVQHTLANLKAQLHSGDIPEFIFKQPRSRGDANPVNSSSQISNGHMKAPSRPGPFARLLLDAIDIPFRYPSPNSPGPMPSVHPTTPKPLDIPLPQPVKLPVTPVTPQFFSENKDAHLLNSKIQLHSPPLSTPQQLKLYPSVVLPPFTPSVDPSQYVVYRGEPPAAIISKKRKRDADEGILQTKAQREISGEALHAVQELIADIFEAENNIQLNGHDARASASGTFFALGTSQEGESTKLAPAILVKLDSCLHKAISLGRFSEIPLDHLLRLQKLCEVSLASTDGGDISLHSGWSDDEVSAWLERLEPIDAGLRAARTALRIMTGGRDEKQIYSEELLQKIIELPCKLLDSCIISVVESRLTGSGPEIFETASSNKKIVTQLLHSAGKIMQLLLELLVQVELAESTVTTIEFFAIRMLFVENASSEKESVLGIHKFENFRRISMNLIAAIFARYTEQRRFIIDEILQSLQKLPTTRQHARQFKLGDGKAMQLVSVLLMRLIQTSAMHSSSTPRKRARRDAGTKDTTANSSDHDNSSNSDSKSDSEHEGSKARTAAPKTESAENLLRRLIQDAKALHDSAVVNAQHVINFFVTRASTSAKTADQPYRHLLDIFVEDLVTVLGQPEWPASELLLRALVSKMDGIAGSDKSTAPAKNMALETLGTLGSAISDVIASARQLAHSLESDDSAISAQLPQLLEDQLGDNLEPQTLYEWTGPYRTAMEYLGQNNSDPQTTSAQGYYLTQWTKCVLWGNRATSEKVEDLGEDPATKDLATKLCMMLPGGKFASPDDYDSVSSAQGRLAYLITINNMGFCRAFGHILKVLIDSVGSDQITVRTRSLKSVTQMLEKDPTLLERTPQVIRLIVKCASDQSSMVRDSALVLIAKCIILKPALELEVLKAVLTCTTDSAVGIRKRAMRLLKDIYLRNSRSDIKAVIADSLLQRVEDLDEGVSELAYQIFEEIWFLPYRKGAATSEQSVPEQVLLKEQVVLVIKTLGRNEKIASVMDALLRHILSNKSKNHEANSKVCKAMVANAFMGMIDSAELPGEPGQHSILQTLTVFARACPKLFTQQHLEHLQPYINSLSTADDLNLFRSVVVVLRCVLPTLPAIQKDFLRKIQADLLANVAKLAKAELNEVVACLWTINGELHNIERLVSVEISVLTKLHKLETLDFASDRCVQEVSYAKRFMHLAGHFAKHCDFQPHFKQFQSKLAWWTGDSVVENVIAALKPFSSTKQPLALRIVAFENIGMICEAWPKNFNHSDTAKTFQTVLREDHPDLQKIVLSSFRDFFSTQDQNIVASTSDEKDPLANGKLGVSMTANDNDGAAALIAQGFLRDILRIALSSQDAYALTATEVMASITRQGLVHPKECGPALVALETSTNAKIAQVAFQQHQTLHQQHESMFEREYMRALHQAFVYQRDVVRSSGGFVGRPYRSKLHSMYEVIKTSKSKYQAKFFSNYCTRVDFDLATLEVTANPPTHLVYATFLIENLAFFEYGRVEDLLTAISCMEKIVAGTGAGVAHVINTELLGMTLAAIVDESCGPVDANTVTNGHAPTEIEFARLLQLTTASMILSMLWEVRTFLRRLYGISGSNQRRESKGKGSKDLTKAPTKVAGITGDKLVETIRRVSSALQSRELSITQCKEFAELLAIDHELKVAAEDDEDGNGRLQTPSVEDDDDSVMPASGGSRSVKRKGSVSINGTPHKKKRGRTPLGGRTGSSRRSVDGEDNWD